MFGYDIHGRQPSVERLVVHMPAMNRVIFHETDDLERVLSNPSAHKTMLSEWFVANQQHLSARTLTYLEFPSKWCWDGKENIWSTRKRQQKFGNKIGCIYHVHPSTGELFFLRMLLMIVPGATCFEDLRVYDDVLYDTFKEACQARGLVGDDNEWYIAFDEAVVWGFGHRLRQLFVTMLMHCSIKDEVGFFERYCTSMYDDIQHGSRRALGNLNHHWCASVLNKWFLTPFRDGIWNRRQVSVCDRVSFPHDPEIIGDRPSWDPGWGRVRSGEASKPNHFRRYVHPTR